MAFLPPTVGLVRPRGFSGGRLAGSGGGRWCLAARRHSLAAQGIPRVPTAAPPSSLSGRRIGLLVVCKKPRVPESIKSKAKASKSTPRGGGFPTSNNISGGLVNNITPLSGHLHMLDACRTLVLDCSHRPIDVVNWQRALCLDIFDKADVLEYYKEPTVRSSKLDYPVPAVVRVSFYVKHADRKLPCSRRFVMIRDEFSCQYCGSRKDLTMDHVHPASKGGGWEWENLVTCCFSCNSKKGDKTLEQLGWKLRNQPKAPSPFEFELVAGMTRRDIVNPPEEWRNYLPPGQLERLCPSR